MKLKKFTLLLLLIFLSVSLTFSQKHSLRGVSNFSRSAISPIYDKSEVKGYIIFYKSDKADKKNDNYGIEFFDENLNKVSTLSMQKPADKYFLLRNSYNGKFFSFYFINYYDKKLEIETYDKGLNKVSTHTISEISRADWVNINHERTRGNNSGYNMLNGMDFHPVPEKGFIRLSYEGKGKGNIIEMFDNNLNLRWKYKPDKNLDYEVINITEITEKYLMGITSRRMGLYSKNMDYFISVFDIENGEKLLDLPIEDEAEQLSLSSLIFDEPNNEFVAVGEYYNLDDKPFVDKSMGLFFKRYGKDGTIRSTILYEWDKDVNPLLPTDAQNSIKNNYTNYIHKILKNQGGKIYIIAEQFKINGSKDGLAKMFITGTPDPIKCSVSNLIIYEIDSNYSLKNIHFYPKEVKDFKAAYNSNWMNAGITGHFIKMENKFDYQFTQISNDATEFSISYHNFKNDGKIKRHSLKNLMVDQSGTFQTDNLDLTSTKTKSSYFYPSKIGYNMIVEYDSKEKEIEMKLVKINR